MKLLLTGATCAVVYCAGNLLLDNLDVHENVKTVLAWIFKFVFITLLGSHLYFAEQDRRAKVTIDRTDNERTNRCCICGGTADENQQICYRCQKRG